MFREITSGKTDRFIILIALLFLCLAMAPLCGEGTQEPEPAKTEQPYTVIVEKEALSRPGKPVIVLD